MQCRRSLFKFLRFRSLRKSLTLLLFVIALICVIAFTIHTRDLAATHTNSKKLDIKYKKLFMTRTFEVMHHSSPNLLNSETQPRNNTNSVELSPYEKVLNRQSYNLNYNVHIFYYAWYGNPVWDGKYRHWNHELIKHWDKEVARKWPIGSHKPPDDIGASFFPSLGTYSSKDPEIVEIHMKQIAYAGVGVVVVSWYPAGSRDSNEEWLLKLFDIAHTHKIKVAFHIEPFEGRNISTVHSSLKYIKEKYGHHPAFFKHNHKERDLPVFYVYDSYLLPDSQWASLLKPHSADTLRGTDLDAFFVGLLVHEQDVDKNLHSGFDAFYTYFASDGFTFGSKMTNWAQLNRQAVEKGLSFIPSVGPGYDDSEVRPWNGQNNRGRLNGVYYRQHFATAVQLNPLFISITSFNEWHEGTQIEMAVPKQNKNHQYKNYLPNIPKFYLDLTFEFVKSFGKRKN